MKKIILYLFLSVNVFAFSPYADDKFDRVLKEVNILKAKVEQQSIQIEGLLSVNGGLSEEMHLLKTKKIPQTVDNTELIKKLAKMIDDINNKYVSKDEFIKAVKKLEGEYFAKTAKTVAKNPQPPKVSYKEKSKELYSMALKNFYTQKYDVAQGMFEELEKRKHRLGSVYFFLGEVHYYNKRYEDSLGYYKLSTIQDDQANYITLLMYHSAYALERVGNKDLAVTFYRNIKDNYADKYARLSEKRLKELKVL